MADIDDLSNLHRYDGLYGYQSSSNSKEHSRKLGWYSECRDRVEKHAAFEYDSSRSDDHSDAEHVELAAEKMSEQILLGSLYAAPAQIPEPTSSNSTSSKGDAPSSTSTRAEAWQQQQQKWRLLSTVNSLGQLQQQQLRTSWST